MLFIMFLLCLTLPLSAQTEEPQKAYFDSAAKVLTNFAEETAEEAQKRKEDLPLNASGELPEKSAAEPGSIVNPSNLNTPPGSINPLELLGLVPAEVVEKLGAPLEVFSYRGRSAGEDNVVFYYPFHLYLFFFNNLVWQVRTDHRYGGEILGLKMGDKQLTITGLLGEPFASLENSRIYLLPYQRYPVKARFVFEEDSLKDLYVYRSDY